MRNSFYTTLRILRQHTEALTGNVMFQDSAKFVVSLNCLKLVMRPCVRFFKLTTVVFKDLTKGSVMTQISLANFFFSEMQKKKLQKQTMLSKIWCRSLYHENVPAIGAVSTESLVHSASLCWKAGSVNFRSLMQYWNKTMGYQVHELITKYCNVVYCLFD